MGTNTITLSANYEIRNYPCPCFKPNDDLWIDYEIDPNFMFCPFCGKNIMREITFETSDYIGHSLERTLKKNQNN